VNARSDTSPIYRRYLRFLIAAFRGISFTVFAVSALVFVLTVIQFLFGFDFGYPRNAIFLSVLLAIISFAVFKSLAIFQSHRRQGL
jgi:hypothetical protein